MERTLVRFSNSRITITSKIKNIVGIVDGDSMLLEAKKGSISLKKIDEKKIINSLGGEE